MDGNNKITLFSNLGRPLNLVLDIPNQHIYWSDENTGKIERGNLDGTGRADVVTGLGMPIGLAILLPSNNINQAIKYTFTNCGQTGETGPSSAQMNSAYVGTNLEGLVTSGWKADTKDGSCQSPKQYWIEAMGARGGNSAKNGGGGTFVKGKFYLSAGDILNIVVGQAGGDLYGSGAGGGGGTFVVADTNNTALIIAGGGGGAGKAQDSMRFSNNESGANSEDRSGGQNGGGGQGGRSGGGGGFFGDGDTYYSGQEGTSYQGGSLGGTPHYSGAVGGFGGGGATHINSWEQGGGGGGYSGGAAARGPTAEEGAGGGSLNGGSDQSIEVNANNDHGKVVIYLSENSNHPSTDLNTIAPLTIAENQPVGTVVGQFNATDPEGEAITYSLINGGVDNHYFT